MGGKTRINAANRNISHGEAVINGTKHNISRGRTRIGGTSQTISFDTTKPGEDWTFNLSGYTGTKCGTVHVGDWKCPATGYYNIELHGGGGAGQAYNINNSQYGVNIFNAMYSGGGSGEIWYRERLTKGQVLEIWIGDGGHACAFNNIYIEPKDKTGHGSNGSSSWIIDKSTSQKKWQVAGGGSVTTKKLGDWCSTSSSEYQTFLAKPAPSGTGWKRFDQCTKSQIERELGFSVNEMGSYGYYSAWIQTNPPAAGGSIAEPGKMSTCSGTQGNYSGEIAKGGLGNKNNSYQSYGNGGMAEGPTIESRADMPGSAGGCIITFVSK